LMDRHFGSASYSVASLFRDEQRKVLRHLLHANLEETTAAYARIYEYNLPTMRFLQHLGAPLPLTFRAAADVLFNTDLRWAFGDDDPDFGHIRTLLDESARWGVQLDARGLSYQCTKMLARTAERWREQGGDGDLLQTLIAGVDLARSLPHEPDLWKVQNVYCELMRTAFAQRVAQYQAGDASAREWLGRFVLLGEKLRVRVEALK